MGGRPDLVVSLFAATGDGHQIEVSGDLDSETIRDIRPQLLTVAERGDGDVHIDLGNVGFADSSAVAMLAAMRKALRASNHELVIESSSTAVSRVLELVGVAGSAGAERLPTTSPESFAHELIFERDPAAPGVARGAATRWLGLECPGLDDVMIVVSELVTNVVLHTDGGGRLQIDPGPPVVLEVHDTSDALPERRSSTGEHGGFGLRLVEQIAERWSAEPTVSGKLVRVQMPIPST